MINRIQGQEVYPRQIMTRMWAAKDRMGVELYSGEMLELLIDGNRLLIKARLNFLGMGTD